MRKPIPIACVAYIAYIACIVRDPLPPVRADLLTLFGAEMPRHGVGTALVGQAGTHVQPAWRAGGMYPVGSFTSRFASILTPLWDGLGLVRAWRAAGRRPDCIQVRDKIASGVLARSASAVLRVPFIYWMSFPIVEGYGVRRDAIGGQVRPLYWLLHTLRAAVAHFTLYRLVLPGARHIFVQSGAMADALAVRGIARARMTAVPMGVDTALFDRRHIALSTDPRLAGRRVLLYLGRIAQSRRSDFLLDVIGHLRAAVPEALLVIAGDAPSSDEMAWMRAEIAQRALGDHVLLTGWLPQRDALGYAVRAEVGLSPIPRGALFDVSSPTKVIEYLALGIPCVGNDIPDQAQVLADSGAGLCVPMEPVAFAGAVRRVLDDPALAAAFAARGPAWVRTHRSYAVLGQHVAQAYAAILARGAA